jgi:DUF1680 family protein
MPEDLSDAKTVPMPGLGGALAIELPVRREHWPHRGGRLYDSHPPAYADTTARLVPYHLWDNREPGEMLVWMRGGR